jgi:hypothetical protein
VLPRNALGQVCGSLCGTLGVCLPSPGSTWGEEERKRPSLPSRQLSQVFLEWAGKPGMQRNPETVLSGSEVYGVSATCPAVARYR